MPAYLRLSNAPQADSSVRAIVLTGASSLFSGGADIREFDTPASMADPTLRQLIHQVETSVKPVVAAIAGSCLGGGLELALVAHYRVASADAKLGLPEVKLGLLPGAGGTQRPPRLVGVEKAIDMIVSGEPVPATGLGNTALLDQVVDGDPLLGAWGSRPQPRSRRGRRPGLGISHSASRTSRPCVRPLGPDSTRSGPCCRLRYAR